ncbi:MAG: HmuY family protein [Myxococcales bacterium]|nr:HmuY family protein [Myxococcales bacterium]
MRLNEGWRLCAAVVVVGLGCVGCDDLPDNDGAAEADAAVVVDGQDGTRSLRVDATDEEAWAYLRLSDGRLGAEGDGWDLALRRFAVRLNGGVGGDGAGLAVFVAGATLEDAARAPDDGWAADAPDGEDDDDLPDRPFDAWYAYDPATHVLTPVPGVWFVRGADGAAYYALRIDDYYDDAGTAGHPSLTWKAVEAPANPPTDAPATVRWTARSDVEDWQYVSLREGASVEVEAPGEDLGWDIAVKGVEMRTNGGTSGAGQGGAYAAEVGVAEGDPARCEADAELPVPGPPGSGTSSGNPALAGWYDYDPMRHQVSPKATAFVVCTADGGVARLQVVDYADGAATLEWVYAGAGRRSF